MQKTFPFHDLGNDEFEDLVAAICEHLLGLGTIVFAPGKDGGRDATFSGCAQKFPSTNSPLTGNFVIQAKHTKNPAASCADTEFGNLLKDEHPKISKLIQSGELDHYLIFTNRKKPAISTIKKEKSIKALGAKTVHILGLEKIRLLLTAHPKIWSDLGFDRFEQSINIRTEDLSEIVKAFHKEISSDSALAPPNQDFNYVVKSKKNKINKLSNDYFQEIITRSLPYFKTIEDFLKNPRNLEILELYEDTTDEIRRKLLISKDKFESFDHVLTYLSDLVTTNYGLTRKRRFVSIFLHYMYYTCDIGQHDNPIKTS